MKKNILLFLIILLSVPSIAFSATLEDLEKRIDELEQDVMMAGDAADDISNLVKISGYADLEYSMSDSGNSTANGARLHHLSLFFKKEITENWRFFSEIEYEDAPLFEFTTFSTEDEDSDGNTDTAIRNKDADAGGGKIFVEAMNVDYLWIPQVNLRFGRFFTPAGIWSVDHYPPFVSTQERPLHIRKIFPQLVDGGMIYGTQGLGGNVFLNYDLYAGNGGGNTGHNDGNSDKAFAAKFSLLLPVLKYFELGGTYYVDTQNSGENIKNSGLHTKIRGFGFTLQAEYADGKNTPDGGDPYHEKGYYAQLMYEWRDIGLGYRNDFYDKSTNDNSWQRRDSFFINYHVTHEINLKLENHLTRDDNRASDHAMKTIASITISLGN